MVIARKIAYNVAVSSISKVLSTILALVAIGFITRYLGKEGFGNYATVLAFLSFFAAIADLGLYHISTREISRPGANMEHIMSNIFTLRVLSSAVVFILAPIIILFFDYSPEVKKGIVLVAGSLIFSSGYQVLNGVFQKNLAMDKVAIGELIGKTIQVAIVILAVKLELGFGWIISSLLFNMLASFLIMFFLVKKFVKIKIGLDFSYWKKFLKESLPIGIGALIVFIYFKMDTILLSIMKSGADVGIYNAAYKVIENIIFFPAMIIGLIMPIMAGTIFANREKFEDVSNKTFKIFVILAVPLILGALFLADEIIMLIGGGQFGESADVLRILIFALAAVFFGVFFNNILIAGNLQKKLMFVWASAAAMNVGLNLWLIPRFSYLASAYISVLSEITVALMSFYFVIKKIKYFPKIEKTAGIIFSGAIMAGILHFGREINFFILAFLSAAAYFFSLWMFKAIKTEEILSLISKKGVEEYDEVS